MGAAIACAAAAFGGRGGEAAEAAFVLTCALTLPCAFVLAPFAAAMPWWLYVLLAWCLQGAVLGLVAGAAARAWRLRELSAWSLLAAVETTVPAAAYVVFWFMNR